MKKLILIAVYMVCSNVSFSQDIRKLVKKLYTIEYTGVIPGKDPENVEIAKFQNCKIMFLGSVKTLADGGGFAMEQYPQIDETTERGRKIKDIITKEDPSIKKIFDRDSVLFRDIMRFKKHKIDEDGKIWFYAEHGSSFELCFGGPITKGYVTYEYIIVHYLKSNSYEVFISNFKGITSGNFIRASTRSAEF